MAARKRPATRADKDAVNRARRERYWSDPQYRAQIQKYQRTYQFQRRRFDPEYAALVREYQRSYYATSTERQKARQTWLRRYWSNPDARRKIQAAARKRYWKIRRDPAKYRAYLDRINEWRRANRERCRAYKAKTRRMKETRTWQQKN